MDEITQGRQTGFTLIELVVVIVILGILAATAAPKFIDISSDAYLAKVNAVEGALKSANTLVYSKAILSNQDKGAGQIEIDGVTINTSDGYIKPTADDVIAALDIDATVFTDPNLSFDTDYGILQNSGTNAGIYIYAKNPASSFKCMLTYRQPDGIGAPHYFTNQDCD